MTYEERHFSLSEMFETIKKIYLKEMGILYPIGSKWVCANSKNRHFNCTVISYDENNLSLAVWVEVEDRESTWRTYFHTREFIRRQDEKED